MSILSDVDLWIELFNSVEPLKPTSLLYEKGTYWQGHAHHTRKRIVFRDTRSHKKRLEMRQIAEYEITKMFFFIPNVLNIYLEFDSKRRWGTDREDFIYRGTFNLNKTFNEDRVLEYLTLAKLTRIDP